MKKILFVLGLVGCASSAPTFRPECSELDAAQIEASYMREALEACTAEGATSLDTCRAAGPIRERFRRQREQWILCGEKE